MEGTRSTGYEQTRKESTMDQGHCPPMRKVISKGRHPVQVVKCTDRISDPRPDSLSSWVVCICGAISNILVSGFAFSYGIVFPAILKEFQKSKAETALIGSLAMMGMGLYGLIIAKIYHRFGARIVSFAGGIMCVTSLIATSKAPKLYVMYLTYGGLFGLGSSSIYITAHLAVPKYFVKWRSLSLGFVAMGSGGLLIVSPIVQELMEKYGWRGTFLAMGGLMAVLCALSCSYRPVRYDSREVNHQNQRKAPTTFMDFSIVRNKFFTLYSIAAIVFYTGHFIPPVHMVRYWEELGLPEKQASHLYIYSSIASIITRPLTGRLCDVRWVNPCYIFIFAATVEGAASLLLPVATTNLHFVLYFILYGVADGALGCGLCVAVLSSLTEKTRPFGFGVFQTLTCITGACGPALGGFVADTEGSYVPVFYMVGALVITGAFIMVPLCFDKPAELEKSGYRMDLDSLIVVEKCSVV